MNFSLLFFPPIFRLPPLGIVLTIAGCDKMNHLSKVKKTLAFFIPQLEIKYKSFSKKIFKKV
jgi:hypothetical protein